MATAKMPLLPSYGDFFFFRSCEIGSRYIKRPICPVCPVWGLGTRGAPGGKKDGQWSGGVRGCWVPPLWGFGLGCAVPDQGPCCEEGRRRLGGGREVGRPTTLPLPSLKGGWSWPSWLVGAMGKLRARWQDSLFGP